MSPRKSEDEILSLLAKRSKAIPLHSTRYHRKNHNNHYRIEDLVFETGTYEIMVIYTALYMDRSIRFSRLARVFLEDIPETPPGQTRFTRIIPHAPQHL